VLTSVLCVCCFVCVRVSVHVQVVHRWTQRTLTKALDTWLLNHQEAQRAKGVLTKVIYTLCFKSKRSNPYVNGHEVLWVCAVSSDKWCTRSLSAAHLPELEDTLVRICVLTSVLCVCCFVCAVLCVFVSLCTYRLCIAGRKGH